MKNEKQRRCRVCREPLSAGAIWVCDACSAAGLGASVRRKGCIDARELLEIVRSREGSSMPLRDMKLDEIAAMAKLYLPPYGTYGKFRTFVELNRRLPPAEFLRK